MGNIKVKIEGFKEELFEPGLSILQVIEKIVDDRAKPVLATKINSKLVDLSYTIDNDVEIGLVFADSLEGTEIIRHSTSHIMAQAVVRLFPDTKCAIGPAIENGFYYDFDTLLPFSSEDLKEIEKEMKKIVKEDYKFKRINKKKQDALEFFKDRGEKYKAEILEQIQDEYVTIYQQGEFVDFCRGPHIPSTRFANNFKLLSVAGSYWHGDERREMLQRIYGTAFSSKEELDKHLFLLDEAKKRDHRVLGKKLEYFSFFDEAPGFPFFQPKGLIIFNNLVELSRREQNKRRYEEVSGPLILSESLWKQSGHYDHYKKNMYFTTIDNFPYAIKPMNCPGHILHYKSQMRSYRELPKKISEMGVVHRHERSGVLHGLFRVRRFTQDDAHIFLREDQLKDEILEIIELTDSLYKKFNFQYKIELSTKPEDAMGDAKLWEVAENNLENALKEIGAKYELCPGEGAFYGPKIDFHIKDSLERSWQCGTIQLDFFMPENFELEYIGEDGNKHRPIIIHRAIMGSIERFMGIVLEHFAGALPFWLSPIQVMVIPIADRHMEFANQTMTILTDKEIRADIDMPSKTLNKRLKNAEEQKIPYMLIIGDKELNDQSVSVRKRKEGDLGSMSLQNFFNHIKKEALERL